MRDERRRGGGEGEAGSCENEALLSWVFMRMVINGAREGQADRQGRSSEVLPADDHLWMWVPFYPGSHPISSGTCNRTREIRKTISFQLHLNMY